MASSTDFEKVFKFIIFLSTVLFFNGCSVSYGQVQIKTFQVLGDTVPGFMLCVAKCSQNETCKSVQYINYGCQFLSKKIFCDSPRTCAVLCSKPKTPQWVSLVNNKNYMVYFHLRDDGDRVMSVGSSSGSKTSNMRAKPIRACLKTEGKIGRIELEYDGATVGANCPKTCETYTAVNSPDRSPGRFQLLRTWSERVNIEISPVNKELPVREFRYMSQADENKAKILFVKELFLSKSGASVLAYGRKPGGNKEDEYCLVPRKWSRYRGKKILRTELKIPTEIDCATYGLHFYMSPVEN